MDSQVTHLHLTEEEVAALAVGREELVGEVRRAHAATCPTCRAAVDEAAVHFELWAREHPALRQESPRPRRASPGTWRRPTLAGAGLTALAALVFLVLLWPSRRDGGTEELVARIRPAIEQTAFGGLFLIPGAENASGGGQIHYRSGFAPISDDLSLVLHELARRYAGQELDGESTAWLVGAYLATGQFGSARDYADDALRRFPDNARIEIIEALLDHRDGDVGGAEARLRNVLRLDESNHLARLNLAILLREEGRVEEAAVMARQVLRNTDRGAVQFRAMSLLQSLEAGR